MLKGVISMAYIIVFLAVFLAGGVLGAFLMLLAGAHGEGRHLSPSATRRSRAGVSSRRLMGVYVRKPGDSPGLHDRER